MRFMKRLIAFVRAHEFMRTSLPVSAAVSQFGGLVFFALAALSATDAPAQQQYTDTALNATRRLTEQEALTYLDSIFSGDVRLYQECSTQYIPNRLTSHYVSPGHVQLSYCRRNVDVTYTEFPNIVHRTTPSRGIGGLLSVPIPEVLLCVAGTHAWCFTGIQDEQSFANAWFALAHPPPPPLPEDDADFQASLQAEIRSGADRTESNRRTQVQVEALVAQGANAEAAARYRQALAESPSWADGHYNLALIAGNLSNYAEAIMEMRRYLYLAPSASDAREAQDQIYRWEAMLGSRSRRDK